MFTPFGEISSIKIKTDDNGNSTGEGFVCFTQTEAAEKAVNEMNKKQIEPERFLIVQKHIKKQENELAKGGNHVDLINQNKQ